MILYLKVWVSYSKLYETFIVNHCSKVGTFLDLGSTDNYVTHKYARKHNLHGENVDLEVEGIGGKKSYVKFTLFRF